MPQKAAEKIINSSLVEDGSIVTDSEFEELVRRLIQKGREAITQVGVTR